MRVLTIRALVNVRPDSWMLPCGGASDVEGHCQDWAVCLMGTESQRQELIFSTPGCTYKFRIWSCLRISTHACGMYVCLKRHVGLPLLNGCGRRPHCALQAVVRVPSYVLKSFGLKGATISWLRFQDVPYLYLDLLETF